MAEVTIKFLRGTTAQWNESNPVLADGEMGVNLDTGQFKLGDGITHWTTLPYAVSKGDPGESGWAERETSTVTTVSIFNNTTEDATLTMQPGYRLLKIETVDAARVRVYDSAANRALDAGRSIGIDPEGAHGVILDFVTTSEILEWWLNPVVDGYTVDGTDQVPIALTNLSGVISAVTVTLTWIRSE